MLNTLQGKLSDDSITTLSATGTCETCPFFNEIQTGKNYGEPIIFCTFQLSKTIIRTKITGKKYWKNSQFLESRTLPGSRTSVSLTHGRRQLPPISGFPLILHSLRFLQSGPRGSGTVSGEPERTRVNPQEFSPCSAPSGTFSSASPSPRRQDPGDVTSSSSCHWRAGKSSTNHGPGPAVGAGPRPAAGAGPGSRTSSDGSSAGAALGAPGGTAALGPGTAILCTVFPLSLHSWAPGSP